MFLISFIVTLSSNAIFINKNRVSSLFSLFFIIFNRKLFKYTKYSIIALNAQAIAIPFSKRGTTSPEWGGEFTPLHVAYYGQASIK